MEVLTYEFYIAAAIGWIANEAFGYGWKSGKRFWKKKKLKNLLKEVYIENKNFLALDRAIPYYDKSESFTLRDSKQSLFISYPEKYRIELLSYKFEFRETLLPDGGNNVITLLEQMGIENPGPLLDAVIEGTAQEFLNDLRAGETRFNGLIYGVRKIRPERLTIDEKSGLDMEFFTTDFFTYCIFSNIHRALLKKNKGIRIEKASDINLFYPFFSSFGLGTFIIINRGYGDEILIGKRSEGVVGNKGKWHYSMNEAFNMRDKDEYGHPSFNACLFRGLEEELGIGEQFKKQILQYEYLDLAMITDRAELGLTAFVRLKLDEKFTFKELMDLYSIAQDGKLETTSITTIPVKQIDDFLTRNDDAISDACRGALKALNTRYKAGYLREMD